MVARIQELEARVRELEALEKRVIAAKLQKEKDSKRDVQREYWIERNTYRTPVSNDLVDDSCLY
jgi:hypothetical protein